MKKPAKRRSCSVDCFSMSFRWVGTSTTQRGGFCCGNYAHMRKNTPLVRIVADRIINGNGKIPQQRYGGRQDLRALSLHYNIIHVILVQHLPR